MDENEGPPTGPPEISGYEETTYLIAGTELVLNCVVMGGYPSPTLKWYFNDVEVNCQARLKSTQPG